MKTKKPIDRALPIPEASRLDNFRQLQYPEEFRIDTPEPFLEVPKPDDATPPDGGDDPPSGSPSDPPSRQEAILQYKLLAEFATFLWYLKTKYFKRKWDDLEVDDDDPRTRRALSRLNKSAGMLRENDIEVHDPTNKRYPPGGEGMMRPIQFLPTDGLTYEVVSEVVSPVIFYKEQLIQRGEVFVSVPKEDLGSAVEPAPDATDLPGNAEPTAEPTGMPAARKASDPGIDPRDTS